MVTAAVTEMLLHDVACYYGTAGAVATGSLGYVLEEHNVAFSFTSPNAGPLRVQGSKLPLRHLQPAREVTVTVPVAQFNADTMALGLGLTKSGDTVTIGDSSDTTLCPQISAAFVGQDLNGDTVRFDALYCSCGPDVDFEMGPTPPPSGLTLVFHCEDYSGSEPFFTFGDLTATIAGGVLTRTTTMHQVVGQGDAADDLDSITGSGLTNGEVLRLRPSTIGYLVTLKHVADTLELFGAADFELGGDLDDWIDLQYVTATTEWIEIARNEPL